MRRRWRRFLASQSREDLLKIHRIGTADVDFLEAKFRSVQLVSRDPRMLERTAVGSIAQNRVAQMSESRADLVEKPRSGSNFDQARSGKLFERKHPLYHPANPTRLRPFGSLDNSHPRGLVLRNHETQLLFQGLEQVTHDNGTVDFGHPVFVKPPS